MKITISLQKFPLFSLFRSHGNEGKVPHNVVTADEGRAISDFVIAYAKKHGSPLVPFNSANSRINNIAG